MHARCHGHTYLQRHIKLIRKLKSGIENLLQIWMKCVVFFKVLFYAGRARNKADSVSWRYPTMNTVFHTWGSFPCSDQAHLSWKCHIGCTPTSKFLVLPGRLKSGVLTNSARTGKEGWGRGRQHLLLSSPWAVLISLPHSHLGFIKAIFISLSFPSPLGCFFCYDSCWGFPRAGGSMICFSSSAHLLISCLRNVSSSQELSPLRHLAWKPVVSACINPPAFCLSGFRTIPTPILGKVF